MRLLVSVSGGRTSGFMAWWVKNNLQTVCEHLGADVEVVYVFANTGREHPETLRFLDRMDNEFGLGIVWVEGVPHPGERKSTTHRVVTYKTAATWDGWQEPDHPFHAFIRKYGIPNTKFLGCTREMKRNTIASYMETVGGVYHTAIGIRADERRRVSKNAGVENIIYPLVDLRPTDKDDVLEWWAQHDWDLAIPEWLGNCVTCYKKSFKKLKKVHEEMPQAYEFDAAMESMYPRVGPEFAKYPDAVDRTFFRMNTSTRRLLATFKETPDVSSYMRQQDAGCSESCEMYETEDV